MSSAPRTPPSALIVGSIDTTYQTQQRDMFESGLAAQIGVSAVVVWMAIKSHADFATGESYPGVRRLMKVTDQASATVQKALKTLQECHLLRISRKVGQRHYYVARERLSVRVGSRVVCTVVVDYVPNVMRHRLERIKAATSAGDMAAHDVWAEVDVIPGPGLTWDPKAKTLRGKLRADEIPDQGTLHFDAEKTVVATGLKKAKQWRADHLASNPHTRDRLQQEQRR